MELTNMIREGDLDGLEKWFQEHPEPSNDEITNGGISIAHWAASGENTPILSLILSKLPQLINQQNQEDGATPLHWAAQDNREKNVSLLLARGAESATDHMGESPLHLAAMNGYLGCAQLLSSAATVNLPSIEGNTPLHLATMNSNKRLVAFLLAQGADPDLENKKKQTARGLAAAKKDKQLLDYFDPEKLLLLEEMEKVKDAHEEMLGQNADLKNVVDAEIRKREAAYTVIKLGEDKIAELEAKLQDALRQVEEAAATRLQQDEQIEKLKTQVTAETERADALQLSIDTAKSQPPPPLTARDFPSELIYSRVKDTQNELQRLARALEQSEQAILTAKTTINILEESLGQ